MNPGITAVTRWVARTAGFSSLLLAHPTPHVTDTAEARARHLVAAEVAADAGYPILSETRLGAERDSLRVAGVEFWRVELPVDHARPFLVGVTRTRAIPLAGFPTPDLYGISRVLGPTRLSLEARARLLAVLADPSGGSHVVFALTAAPMRTVDSLFVRRWREALPASWPRDTVFEMPNGAHVLVQSVLSRDEHDLGLRWTALVYRFVLSRDGSVESWARASTDPFQMPEKMGALVR